MTKQLNLPQGNVSHIRLAGDSRNLDRPCDDNADEMTRWWQIYWKKKKYWPYKVTSAGNVCEKELAKGENEKEREATVCAGIIVGLHFIGDECFVLFGKRWDWSCKHLDSLKPCLIKSQVEQKH